MNFSFLNKSAKRLKYPVHPTGEFLKSIPTVGYVPLWNKTKSNVNINILMKKRVWFILLAIFMLLIIIIIANLHSVCLFYLEGYRNKITGKCSSNYSVHCESPLIRKFYKVDHSCLP